MLHAILHHNVGVEDFRKHFCKEGFADGLADVHYSAWVTSVLSDINLEWQRGGGRLLLISFSQG